MVDQALGLGATIGSMVRALTGPMRESNSRLGKTQVAETLRGEADHGIRLIYLSPERLADSRFRELISTAVDAGIVRRIAIDEAHTLVSWGDDFRPSFRRMDRWLAGLKAAHPELAVAAFTATANRTVREGLRTRLFNLQPGPPGGDRARFVTVAANPLRADLAIWRRRLAPGGPARHLLLPDRPGGGAGVLGGARLPWRGGSRPGAALPREAVHRREVGGGDRVQDCRLRR